MPRRPEDTADKDLTHLYAGLESLFAAASCGRSTRCCRFAQTGRTPYLWPVEARRVLKAVDRRGGRLPKEGAQGDCPLLLGDGSCSIYADRPFGCRTFFCREANLPEGNRRPQVEALSKRLRALSESIGGATLLPLTTWLDRAFDRDGRRIRGRR